MKAIKYQLCIAGGKRIYPANFDDFIVQLGALRRQHIGVIPLVLVDVLPEGYNSKSNWLKLNEYTKLSKKEAKGG